MRIARLTAVGFRGIRDQIDLDFPSTFVVITGNNGSGKSTICDAIEYALTGKLAKPYMHVEKGEGLADYLWWRGSANAPDHRVQLTLVGRDGTRLMITRTPDTVAVEPSSAKLSEQLSDPTSAPAEPIEEICLTSILRDESITDFSIDMKETERFQFVQDAIGVSSLTAIVSKTDAIVKELNRRVEKLEGEYSLARSRVEPFFRQLSMAEAERARTENVADAERTLRRTIHRETGQLDSLIEAARLHLSTVRQRIAAFEEIERQEQALRTQRASIETPAYAEQVKNLDAQVRELEATLHRISSERAELDRGIAAIQNQEPTLAALAELHTQGQRLGLRDSRCPLCGSAIASEEFQKHLDLIHAMVTEQHSRLAALTERRAALAAAERQATTHLVEARRNLDIARHAAEAVAASYAQISGQLERLQANISPVQTVTLATLRTEVTRLRDETVGVEAALSALQGSLLSGRVDALQRDLDSAQTASSQVEQQLAVVSHALDKAKLLSDTVKRVSNEVAWERLESLDPLMGEFYGRLRPHAEWQDIHYRMRGDVRRFVSLTVGDERNPLNPRFMFSSGQRRALGLAFLLAVHMSREWCKLRTLILDDPVQHVDDYRALHLAEVLSAIRRADRQIVCTVEDSALAGLLTRRLRSTPDEDGALVTMAYGLHDGVHLESVQRIKAPRQVLVQKVS